MQNKLSNLSNQMATLQKQIKPIVTLKGGRPMSAFRTMVIHRRTMQRFSTDSNGSLSIGLADLNLPGQNGDNSCWPLKFIIRGPPLQYLSVVVAGNIFIAPTGGETIGFPSQTQAHMCPARVTPSIITVDIPDVYATRLADLNKIFSISSAPSASIFIEVTYCQVIQA